MPTPAAPTILGLVSKDRSVYLNWTVPSSDSDIVDYVIQRKLADEPDENFTVVEPISKSDSPSAPGATIDGVNGVGYVLRVAARNEFGTGEYSSISSVITPLAIPSKPPTPTCIAGDNQIIVNWTAPADGGSAITDYIIQSTAMNPNSWSTKPDSVSAATTYTALNLRNGFTYYFRIAAVNASGQSPWSNSSLGCIPASLPGAPAFLLTIPHNGYVHLSWMPQYSGGTNPVNTVYLVQSKLATDPDTSFAVVYEGKGVPDGSRKVANITGLTNGTAYVFRVAAKTVMGTGAYGPKSKPVTPRSVPGAINPPAGIPGNGQITLNWQAPSNGGAPITFYDIEVQWIWKGKTSWPQPIRRRKGANTSRVVDQLINGASYKFRIRANNAAGAGAFSAWTDYIIPRIDVPAAPTNLSVSLVGNSSVRLAFTPPYSSAPITGYVVITSTDGEWDIIDSNYQLGTLVYGLTDEPHTFMLAAKNVAGIGLYSNESNSVTPSNKLFNKSSWYNILEEPYRTWLNKAADRWDRYIKYSASARATIASENNGWNGLALGEFILFSDSKSNELAASQMLGYKALGGKEYNSINFYLEVNDFWRAWGTYTEKDWVNILTHELGHALGVGIYWGGFQDWEVYFPGATPPFQFFLSGNTYAGAQAAYNSITRLNRSRIPLENTGGAGTASGHWDDSFRPATAPGSLGLTYPGFRNEIMVGYFRPNVTFVISQLTIKTLVDFGWQEINPGASEGNPTLKLNSSALAPEIGDVHKCGFDKIKNKIIPQQIGTVGLTVDVESTSDNRIDT